MSSRIQPGPLDKLYQIDSRNILLTSRLCTSTMMQTEGEASVWYESLGKCCREFDLTPRSIWIQRHSDSLMHLIVVWPASTWLSVIPKNWLNCSETCHDPSSNLDTLLPCFVLTAIFLSGFSILRDPSDFLSCIMSPFGAQLTQQSCLISEPQLFPLFEFKSSLPASLILSIRQTLIQQQFEGFFHCKKTFPCSIYFLKK